MKNTSDISTLTFFVVYFNSWLCKGFHQIVGSLLFKDVIEVCESDWDESKISWFILYIKIKHNATYIIFLYIYDYIK